MADGEANFVFKDRIQLEFWHRYYAPQVIDFANLLLELLSFEIAKLNLGKFEKFKKI